MGVCCPKSKAKNSSQQPRVTGSRTDDHKNNNVNETNIDNSLMKLNANDLSLLDTERGDNKKALDFSWYTEIHKLIKTSDI
jgi:hypothetical protein